MARTIDIVAAVQDPNILGDVLSPTQEAALRTLYGLPIPREQESLVRRCTGHPPRTPREHREAAFVCGRRSGKSDKICANVSIYEAFFRKHVLSAGERGVVLLLAQNMRQAQVVRGYIEGKVTRSPILSRHVEAIRSHEIDLDNRITIAIYPASFRSIRGLSVVACICDEIAFWFTEEGYANPDVEVLRAVRPSMATFPNAKLVLASSPYAMTSVLWDMWRDRKKDREVLVWHAPTALMNPAVPEGFLRNEKRRDPENYRREYEAEFTEAVGAFLPAEAIEACVVRERIELPPDGNASYVATIDAAFKGDRFVFAIGHRTEEDMAVVDHLSSWQGTRENPVKLSTVIPAIQAQHERYRFYQIYGDQFASEPIKHALQEAGLSFEEVPFTLGSKADLYGNLRAHILDRRVEFLDHKESLRELRGLEVELLPGGNARVRHGGSGHDDFADAIALLVQKARRPCSGEVFAGVNPWNELERELGPAARPDW